MIDPIHILLVDDEPELADTTAYHLEQTTTAFTVTTTTNPTDAHTHLQNRPVDCIVADYDLPDQTGLELLETVRETHPELPFILYTATGSEAVASDAISAGVTDYLQKHPGTEQYDLLANRIQNAVDQVRAKRQVQLKDRQYRQLFEHAPIMYVLVRDVDGWPIIDDCNDRFVEKLGYDREEIIGRPTTDFFTDDSTQAVYEGEAYARAQASEFDLEERTLVTKDGSTVETLLRASPRLDEQGDVIGVQTLYLDITERKRRESELERYERILEASGDAVYTLDAEGYLTFVNDAFCDLVGYSEEELLGEYVSVVMDAEDIERGEAIIRELLSSETDHATWEMDLIRADGDRVRCETHVALLTDDDDESFRGTTGIHRDITERKQRERELEEKNDRLEKFASIVSHDLRTPLTVAQGRLELAQAECASEHLDHVARAQKRMQSLTEDLLVLAREGDAVQELEPVGLDRVVSECWQTVATAEATLRVEADGRVVADESRLRQMFENLFENAVEYGGAEVTITVGELSDGFFVADTGPGIPGDDREAVFEYGYSSNNDGTGVGLSIVREVVEAHGWEISVTESDAGGARFEVSGIETA